MKAIQLKKTVFEIPFNDEEGNEVLKLEFDRSDENIKRLYSSTDGIEKKLEVFEKSNNDDDFEGATTIVKEMVDSILSEGSFDKLYKLNPSLQIVITYFYQIVIGIKEELVSEDIKAVVNKYLK